MASATELRQQAQDLLKVGAQHEADSAEERGKKRVFALIFAYGEYQKAAIQALNAGDDELVAHARDGSLRALRDIEPLLAKRKRKKPRGRSVIP